LENFIKEDEKEEKEDNNTFIVKIIQELKKCLAEFTQKIKRVLNSLGLEIQKTDIKPTIPKVLDGRLAQLLKVSLCDILSKKLLIY
jgi:predicted metalloenzyme YecM